MTPANYNLSSNDKKITLNERISTLDKLLNQMQDILDSFEQITLPEDEIQGELDIKKMIASERS